MKRSLLFCSIVSIILILQTCSYSFPFFERDEADSAEPLPSQNLTLFSSGYSSYFSACLDGEGFAGPAWTRGGIGLSYGRLLGNNFELEGGITYFFNGSLVNTGFEEISIERVLFTCRPAYVNLIYHARNTSWPHLFYGGGLNFSEWTLTFMDTAGTDWDYKPSGTVGFQLLTGIDAPHMRWEIGYRWNYGSFKVHSGPRVDVENRGIYFKAGFKLI